MSLVCFVTQVLSTLRGSASGARKRPPNLPRFACADLRFEGSEPKYRKPDGLFPFVRLKSHNGEQYPMAEVFVQEITKLYEEREARRIRASLSPQRAPRLSNLSLERFRTLTPRIPLLPLDDHPSDICVQRDLLSIDRA